MVLFRCEYFSCSFFPSQQNNFDFRTAVGQNFSQTRTDPQRSLNHLPLTMTLHSSTDQQTKMLVLIIFSCMNRNKVICKMCDLNVLFFLRDFRKTLKLRTKPRARPEATRRLHPQLLPESPIVPPEYLPHIYTFERSRTFMFTCRNKDLIGAHNSDICLYLGMLPL